MKSIQPPAPPRITLWLARIIQVFCLLTGGLLLSYLGIRYLPKSMQQPLSLGHALSALAVSIAVFLIYSCWPQQMKKRSFLLKTVVVVGGITLICMPFRATTAFPALLILMVGVGWQMRDGTHRIALLLNRFPRLSQLVFNMFIGLLLLEVSLQLFALVISWRTQPQWEPAQSGDFGILCLGDSFTFGVGASDRQHSWPAVLQTELRHALPEMNITVHNAGYPCRNSSTLRKKLAEALPQVKPRIVIACCGANNTWNTQDMSFDLLKGLSRERKWKRDAYQWGMRLRIVKLMRLSTFRFITEEPVPQVKKLTQKEIILRNQCLLAFVSKGKEWMGEEVFAAIVEYMTQKAPQEVQCCWALGLRLAGHPIPTKMPVPVVRNADAVMQAMDKGDLDRANQLLWSNSRHITELEKGILSACADVRAGNTVKAASAMLAFWESDQPNPLPALMALQWLSLDAHQLRRDIHTDTLAPYGRSKTAFIDVMRLSFPLPILEKHLYKIDPGNHAILSHTIRDLYAEHESVIQLLQHALASDPDWQWAWREKGYRLALLFRDQEAVEALNKALAINPQDHHSLYWKARALTRMGQKKAALEAFNKAVQCGMDPYLYRPGVLIILDMDGKLYQEHLARLQKSMPDVYDLLPRLDKTKLDDDSLMLQLDMDLEDMQRQCLQSGALFFVHTYPFDLEAGSRLSKFGDRNNCLLISHIQAFDKKLKTVTWEELFQPDGHCTDAGYEIMADNILPQLVPVIKRISAGQDIPNKTTP
jgi:tetratricopeptide (TPR) repeat protein